MFEEHEIYEERRQGVRDDNDYETQQKRYPDPEGFQFEDWEDEEDDEND